MDVTVRPRRRTTYVSDLLVVKQPVDELSHLDDVYGDCGFAGRCDPQIPHVFRRWRLDVPC